MVAPGIKISFSIKLKTLHPERHWRRLNCFVEQKCLLIKVATPEELGRGHHNNPAVVMQLYLPFHVAF